MNPENYHTVALIILAIITITVVITICYLATNPSSNNIMQLAKLCNLTAH